MTWKRPNIVFILSDDQGYWALGCQGNPEIRTPNLDALARQGVRFANFFCTSPVCSPARASILTGRIPSGHGVHDWVMGGNSEDDFERSGVKDPIEYLAGSSGYTDVLADNGYRCGIVGKWHLGYSAKPQKGFSEWYVFKNVKGYLRNTMIDNGVEEQVTDYITDTLTDKAVAFLDHHGHSEIPFCLHVHYNAPHAPWIDQHPAVIVDSYDECPFKSCPQEPAHPWTKGKGERPAIVARENHKGYFAAVTAMDGGIGRILEKLNELNIREDTLVMFMSDNGMNLGHHGIWGKGNGTFPQNMYDTSVKIPAIVSHPGTLPEGIVCDALLSQYDVRPTLLEYAGMEDPEAEVLPGRSFLPCLEGNTQSFEERSGVVVYDEYGSVRMIRTREWKYVHRYPYGPHELYDLASDPGERTNLYGQTNLSGIALSLRTELMDWFQKHADPYFDGTRHEVTGDGQRGRVGRDCASLEPFAMKKTVLTPRMEAQSEW